MALKQTVISAAARLQCFPIGFAAQRALWGNAFIRVVNYHRTPSAQAGNFERQLAFFARHYTPATPDDLDACIAGAWRPRKPGIILTFDDGFRSNHDVGMKLLEKHGFRGWFFLPLRFIAATREEADFNFAQPGARGAEPRLSWPECRDMAARGHIIGCHTRSNLRLKDGLPAAIIEGETGQARLELGEVLGREAKDFCWVGGEVWSYGREAFAAIPRGGYARAFMTNMYPVRPGSSPYWIQRNNIEADWPLERVQFYLSGLMDIAYWPKRRQLAARLLRPAR